MSLSGSHQPVPQKWAQRLTIYESSACSLGLFLTSSYMLWDVFLYAVNVLLLLADNKATLAYGKAG